MAQGFLRGALTLRRISFIMVVLSVDSVVCVIRRRISLTARTISHVTYMS